MTEISDEAVKEALRAFDENRWKTHELQMRAALRSAYASGYAAAREQAAGVAQNGDWELGEGVHAGTPRDIAAAIRAMEPNT